MSVHVHCLATSPVSAEVSAYDGESKASLELIIKEKAEHRKGRAGARQLGQIKEVPVANPRGFAGGRKANRFPR